VPNEEEACAANRPVTRLLGGEAWGSRGGRQWPAGERISQEASMTGCGVSPGQ
jgi:hypothetical protein